MCSCSCIPKTHWIVERSLSIINRDIQRTFFPTCIFGRCARIRASPENLDERGAKLFFPLQFRTPVRTHLHTANQRPRVLICIQPIHRGLFNPRYILVRPPLLPSAARSAVGKATCSTALHCLFSGCEFKSSCWLFFCYNKMGNNGVYSVRGDTQMMK